MYLVNGAGYKLLTFVIFTLKTIYLDFKGSPFIGHFVPYVLKRFMRMTESGNAGDMMDTISTIARFTASLQLLLYTVIA